MEYVTGKKVLTSKGWESNIQIGFESNGRIGYVGEEQSRSSQSLDLILPAPANLHSHAFQRAMAGLTEMHGQDLKDSFWTWRKLMYRFLDHINPDQFEAITTLAFMEMLESGYGSVAEFHYLHHALVGQPYRKRSELSERIVAAAETTGIGLTLLPVLYQYSGCGKRALQSEQLRFYNSLDQFAQIFSEASEAISTSWSDYTIGVASHSLRAVDPQGLKWLTELNPKGVIHMHLAEQPAEVEEVLAHLKARPTEWLLDNYEVDERWCLIHCTQITLAETMKLAKSHAVVGLCPITESSLGDGIFNARDFIDFGGIFGIGSDSNIHISLFEELKTLEYSQRLRDQNRAVLASQQKSTGRNLFDMVSTSGAQATQRCSGTIKVGMLADMMGICTDNQWIMNRSGDVILDCLVFGGHARECITDVWSAGRHVVKDGHHYQSETIIKKFKQAITELGQDI